MSQIWLLFNLHYLGQYSSYYIQTGYDGTLTHGLEFDFDNVYKACPFCAPCVYSVLVFWYSLRAPLHQSFIFVVVQIQGGGGGGGNHDWRLFFNLSIWLAITDIDPAKYNTDSTSGCSRDVGRGADYRQEEIASCACDGHWRRGGPSCLVLIWPGLFTNNTLQERMA